MSTDSVRALVADHLAKIKGGEGVDGLRTNTMIRYWEHIAPAQVEACITYLREYTASKNGSTARLSVEDLQVDKTTLSGYWRGGKVTFERESSEEKAGNYIIYQELHEGFITTTKSGGAVVFTDWISGQGRHMHSGAVKTVLRLPNVDPANAEDIREELWALQPTISNPACRYETVEGTHYFTECRAEIQPDGSQTIELILWKLADPITYVKVGLRKSESMEQEQRLYEDIPAAYVETLIDAVTVQGDYTLVDSDARKTSEAGIFDVYVTMRTPVTNLGYIVAGRRKTLVFEEEKRLYRGILTEALDALTNNITLGSYTLVGTDVRKTGEDGVWDVVLTMRTMLTPPGGKDIVIGGTSGLFKTVLHVWRNVPDGSVEATVSGLLATQLISNVRASPSREAGYWDVFYTELMVPVGSRTEYEITQEFKELPTRYETSVNIRYGVYRYMDEYWDQTPIYDFMPCTYIRPATFAWLAGKQDRKITVKKIITYSAGEPSAPTYGTTTELTNGIWKKVSVTTTHPWWT